MAVPSLVAVADLASYVQRDFDAADAYTAEVALDVASALVRNYLRQTVTSDTYTVGITIPPSGVVTLHQKPVSSITSVLINGTEVAWTFIGNGFTIDPFRYGGAVAVITYTAGYPEGEVPADIRGVVMDVAARRMENPRGLQSETIGSYSYSMPQTSGSAGGGGLTLAEKDTLDACALGRPGSGVGMLDLA